MHHCYYSSFPDICSCASIANASNMSEPQSEIVRVQVDSCFGINGPCVCNSTSCSVSKNYLANYTIYNYKIIIVPYTVYSFDCI